MQTFSKSFIVFDYYANTGNYAKDCINKAKPWLHCNGKCQMMKKMQHEEKRDQENPERKADNKNETVLFSKSFFASITTPAPLSIKLPKLFTKNSSVSPGLTLEIFHPPQIY